MDCTQFADLNVGGGGASAIAVEPLLRKLLTAR